MRRKSVVARVVRVVLVRLPFRGRRQVAPDCQLRGHAMMRMASREALVCPLALVFLPTGMTVGKPSLAMGGRLAVR
jgi:hypothetical protein